MNENEKKVLNDQELEGVTGGWYTDPYIYETKESVVFKWKAGEHVEKVRAVIFGHVFTYGCTVQNRKADVAPNGRGFCAWYTIIGGKDSDAGKWFPEDAFEHGYKMISNNMDF